MKKVICILISLMLIGIPGVVSAAGAKSTRAPVINYTLSETEDTWNPITVTLDVTGNNRIVKLNYVRMSYKYWGWSPPFENGVDSSSVSYKTDIVALYETDIGFDTGEENVQKLFSDACGGYEEGSIAYNYYCNALCGEQDPNKEIIGPKDIIGNSFTVYHNGPYIVYAEDGWGNKSYRFIKIDNIKSTSFDVDVKVSSDVLDKNVAEIRLNNLVENPNAPIKSIYLYEEVPHMHSVGGSDWLLSMPIWVNRIKGKNLIVTPVDGVYYIDHYGKYCVLIEDAWGNYKMSNEISIDPPFQTYNLAVYNKSGEKLSKPPVNEDFKVKIDVEAARMTELNPKVILALYDNYGALMDMECSDAVFAAGNNGTQCEFSIPAQSKAVDSVKVFVWNSLEAMNPLTNVEEHTYR